MDQYRRAVTSTGGQRQPLDWLDPDENQFVGPTPLPEDALNIIRSTVDGIDFWGLAQYYDNGD
jgi:hypothetical protein